MDDGFVQIKDRETDIIARQLSQAIVRSNEYRDYREALAALKEQPDLYAQVNELRRQNFARQNGMEGTMSYEEYSNLSALSKNLHTNPVASRFLNSEVGLGRLIQDINRNVMSDIEFDSEFLG